MKNKLQEFYNASYPILRKVDNSINIEIFTSLKIKSLYIATTYYCTYYEDNGDFVAGHTQKALDKILSYLRNSLINLIPKIAGV